MLKIFNFVMILIGIFIALAILIGSLILSTHSTTKRLTNTTEEMHLGDDKYFGLNFRITDYHYFDRSLLLPQDNQSNASSNICLNPKSKEIVILKIVLDTDELPDRCDIFIDSRFVKSLDVYDYDCRPICASDKIEQQVDLKAQDVFSKHKLEVCCDSICTSEELEPIC